MRAYSRSVARFLAWCEEQGVELREITPGLVGEYIGQLAVSPPTKNQALAPPRHFIDCLVTRRAVALNPFASVVGILDYTGTRVGAVARLRLGDSRNLGELRSLRRREKGGKVREIPVRHDLDAWLREYLDVARQDDEWPLFRRADGKRKQLTAAGYRAYSMRQMLKRRLAHAGLPPLFSPHSFRVSVVTVPLEEFSTSLARIRGLRRFAIAGRDASPGTLSSGFRFEPAMNTLPNISRDEYDKVGI